MPKSRKSEPESVCVAECCEDCAHRQKCTGCAPVAEEDPPEDLVED